MIYCLQANGFTISGDTSGTNSLSLQGMTGVTDIIANWNCNESDRSAKGKSTERMKVLEINDSLGLMV